MRPILLLTLLILSFCKSGAQTIMGRQRVDQFSRSSTGVLTYGLTWVPVSYANTTRTYPLIIALHGTGEVGTTQADLAKLYSASPRSVSGRIAPITEPSCCPGIKIQNTRICSNTAGVCSGDFPSTRDRTYSGAADSEVFFGFEFVGVNSEDRKWKMENG